MHNNETTVRPWWKLGPLVWLGILLLALVNIAVFTDWLAVDRRSVIWFIHCCDPHRWPTGIAYLLWGFVLWMFLGLPRWPKPVRQLRWIALALFVIGVGVTLLIQYDVHTLAVRRRLYHEVYLRYFVTPFTNYMADGKLHRTMLITPICGATALGLLIYLAVRLRKKRPTVETEPTDPT